MTNQERYKLGMATVCEDWANLLLNERWLLKQENTVSVWQKF